MEKDFWKRMLKGFRAHELDALLSLLWEEKRRRIYKRIAEGRIEKLTEEEKQLNRDDAVKSYKERVKCRIWEAKMVVDKELGG